MFQRFQTYYGTEFNVLWHGIPFDKVKEAWVKELAGFTTRQLVDAVRAIVCEYKTPPNLPRFLEVARKQAIHKQVHYLEHHEPCSTEVAMKILKKIREKFPKGAYA